MDLNEILRGYAAAQLKFLQQQESEPVDTGETKERYCYDRRKQEERERPTGTVEQQ
jgi:hypothetical protein